jgi:hypothetical protein
VTERGRKIVDTVRASNLGFSRGDRRWGRDEKGRRNRRPSGPLNEIETSLLSIDLLLFALSRVRRGLLCQYVSVRDGPVRGYRSFGDNRDQSRKSACLLGVEAVKIAGPRPTHTKAR